MPVCYMCSKPVVTSAVWQYDAFCSQECLDKYYEEDDPGDTYPEGEDPDDGLGHN